MYLRAKDNDGNLSDDVLKVEFEQKIYSFSKSNLKRKSKNLAFSNIISNKTKSFSKKEDEFEQTIDINFEGLEPGKFCYAICVFVENADGNGGEWVSQPGDVCVEVEAWGGNAAIAGDWNFIKFKDEFLRADCETDCLEIQELLNNTETESTAHCNNSYVPSKNMFNIKSFKLNSDGTFFMELKNTDKFICDGVSKVSEENTKVYGNWAYDEDLDEITIVLFKVESDLEEPLAFEVDELEDGILWVNKAPIKLNGSNLEIKHTVFDDLNGTNTITLFLER